MSLPNGDSCLIKNTVLYKIKKDTENKKETKVKQQVLQERILLNLVLVDATRRW